MKSITIELKGSITIGQGDIKLREGIHDVVEQGYELIILDFSEVNYLDSSGLGELVAANEFAKKRGRDIAVVNVQKRVQKLLYISLLIEKLSCFDTREEAMEHFLALQV